MLGIVNIFETFQGESSHRGERVLFVRTSGCSVGCPQCDTDYRLRERLSIDAIQERIRKSDCKKVWVTGGEPTDWPKVHELPEPSKEYWLATAGVRSIPQNRWKIYCSPHSTKIVNQRYDEVNLVPLLNDLTPDACRKLAKSVDCDLVWVTPMEGSLLSLGISRDLVKEISKFRDCRLGIQAHKVWGVA